jgi:hypothetical protein
MPSLQTATGKTITLQAAHPLPISWCIDQWFFDKNENSAKCID